MAKEKSSRKYNEIIGYLRLLRDLFLFERKKLSKKNIKAKNTQDKDLDDLLDQYLPFTSLLKNQD